MIIFDKNSKNLEIPAGLGNLDITIISGGTGTAGVASLNGQTGNLYLKTVNGNGLLGQGNIEIDVDEDAIIESAVTEAKSYTDTAIEEAVFSGVTEDYYTSGETDNAIQEAMNAETARTEQTYLKEHQSLADYYTSAQTQEYVAEEIFDLPTRDEMEQAISAATANMVTSTYVNNIWVGTTAQYNAITTKDPNTLYFINDN